MHINVQCMYDNLGQDDHVGYIYKCNDGSFRASDKLVHFSMHKAVI